MHRTRAYQEGPEGKLYRARIAYEDGSSRILGPYATVGPARAQRNSHGKGRAVVEAVVEVNAGPWVPVDFAQVQDAIGEIAKIEAQRAEADLRSVFAEILESFVGLSDEAHEVLLDVAPDLTAALDDLNSKVVHQVG